MTDTPGTPAVPAMHAQGLVNLAVRGLLRTPGLSRIIGSRLVTLYVAGRQSGRRYTVPVSYLAHGDDLLIGTSSGWARNLRTGEPVAFRFKGKIRRVAHGGQPRTRPRTDRGSCQRWWSSTAATNSSDRGDLR